MKHAPDFLEMVLDTPKAAGCKNRPPCFLDGNEPERNGINAVARILPGKTFTQEHMAQMTAAPGASNFCPGAVRIREPLDRPVDFIIETGPPAPGIEFIFRNVQGRIAPSACVEPLGFIFIVFAGKRAFRTFMDDDIFFFLG